MLRVYTVCKRESRKNTKRACLYPHENGLKDAAGGRYILRFAEMTSNEISFYDICMGAQSKNSWHIQGGDFQTGKRKNTSKRRRTYGSFGKNNSYWSTFNTPEYTYTPARSWSRGRCADGRYPPGDWARVLLPQLPPPDARWRCLRRSGRTGKALLSPACPPSPCRCALATSRPPYQRSVYFCFEGLVCCCWGGRGWE